MSCLARRASFCLVLLVLSLPLFAADTPVQGRNSDAAYQQLRNLTLGAETVGVSNLTLHRDAATFHLRSGAICFVAPVAGKVTGAVFVGEGNLVLAPPLPSEISSLKLFTGESEFSENFSQAVFRFTDSTYDELKKAGSAGTGGCDAGLLRDSQDAMRHNRMLKWNLEARLLQDVLSTEPGGFFLAFIHGKKYNGKEIYAIDPHGAPPLIMPVGPEEVEFVTYDENKLGVWAAFHFSDEYKQGTATGSQSNGVIHIEHQQLETTIEKSANLTGKATTTFVSRVNGIQEDKHDDADFSVILPKALAAGEKYTITTKYNGKEAVSNEGNGNYFPLARDDWYPNNASFSLGEYTAYDMTFRIPKGMKIAATGSLISDTNDSGQNVSVWKSEVPQTVAGFNFGRFKVEEAKLAAPEYLVQSYANEEPPDWVRSLQHAVD
ncbi:MAG: hypothetical protein HYR57_02430, partial [Candidatus Koribacter versatilis]|nr:hypothetical protein [Candidatus Koribacter versatilis]